MDVSSVSRQEPPVHTSLAFAEISPDGNRSVTFYHSTPAAALAYMGAMGPLPTKDELERFKSGG